jgi:cytochrome P450
MHSCLGRHLARLELTRLIPKFLAVSGDLELIHPGQQPNWTLEVSTTGLHDLPVRRVAV